MSIITVTNGNDSGTGSLRAALENAGNEDIIDFASGVTSINLTLPLDIDHSVDVEGDFAHDNSMISVQGAVVVQQGSTVTFSHLNLSSTNTGADASSDGEEGDDGDDGAPGINADTMPGQSGTMGGFGTNGTDATAPSGVGANAGPTLENDGNLTLIESTVVGTSVAGSGADGADGGGGGGGGTGGNGGDGGFFVADGQLEYNGASGAGANGGDGGNGGNGSAGTDGGDAVGGVVNTGTLTLQDSAISGSATGGDGGGGGSGGAGGDAGPGGYGGNGGYIGTWNGGAAGSGGNGGSAGTGGDGGSGGSAVGGMVNAGTVKITGAAALDGDSATGGKYGEYGAGGTYGSGALPGNPGAGMNGGSNGASGVSGYDGYAGADGSDGYNGAQTTDYEDNGSTTGDFTLNGNIYDLDEDSFGQPSVASVTTGSPTTFSYAAEAFAVKIATGTVDWQIVTGANGAPAGDFAGPTSGTLTFSSAETPTSFSVELRDDASAPRDESFTVELTDPSTGDVIGSDGSFVQEVTNTAAPCYCPGTLIATSGGEVPVEHLAIDDLVVTAAGSHRRIKWIGRRSYAGRFVDANPAVLPICFKADSLDVGVPSRDLWVSPKHAMFLDGVLIPAEHLVNGVTITQAESVERVDYYHIELDSHDVIVAEGALSETFVDDRSRGMFHNAHEFAALYPAAERIEAVYCAPRVEDGFQLQAVRHRLAARAGLPAHGCRPGGPLRGCLERVDGGRVTGWAQSEGCPDAPVCLDVLVDNVVVAQVVASTFRHDLLAAGIGDGCHAFEARVAAVPSGKVTVRRSADHAALRRLPCATEALTRAA